MPNTSISTTSVEEFVGFLGEVKQLDFISREVWDAIGEQLKIQTEKRFTTETDPDGNAWTPLSEKYQKRKAKQANYQKLLQYSGKLLDMLAYQTTDYGVKFGSNEVYARTHQKGDAKRGIPKRAFLGINEDDKKAIVEELFEAWQAWLGELR